jgi:uncharacterized membrane protein
MKRLLKYFINGLLTILPIVLAVYIIYKIFTFLDSILGNLLKDVLKEDYIPGIGLITTIVLITFLGWMSTQYVTGKIFRLIDRILERTPFVKTVYTVIKDTIHSFFGEKRSFSTVVLIEYPEIGMKSIGFITTEELSSLGEDFAGHVAVYIPQTFQIAGFTFLVPKEKLKILDVKPEEAMKFLLSGGVATK